MIATTAAHRAGSVKNLAQAIAGLMSGAAFAQTSVTVGGKFDAGYQFKHTQNTDTAGLGTPYGASNGGKTTELKVTAALQQPA